MKVLLVNGSPHQKGTTNRALTEMVNTFAECGIETEIFWIGNKPIQGCIACGLCGRTDFCAFDNDPVNEFLDKAEEADGFVFGSPVYYAGPSGQLCAFLDRVFYAAKKDLFAFKPGAAWVSARRAGTTAAFDRLNKYFTIAQMPVISSKYWNNTFGANAEDAEEDLEGLQTARMLARNMAWFLRIKEAGEKAGIYPPEPEEIGYGTNFIRRK